MPNRTPARRRLLPPSDAGWLSPQQGVAVNFWPWVIGFFVLIFVLFLIFVSKFINLWIQATLTKANIGLFHLVGMQLRKVNPTVIARARISAVQAGLDTAVRDLEAHYLAGGNVLRVVGALIASDRANLDLDFKRACAIDLAGRHVLEAVQTCVNPKVIDCPANGKIAAMAKDGIQVLAKAR
ncbi:MAG: flotillin-like FloA family protein, partial [Planctomycetes bacterium]|nr:flotillin-like FloA family protein [Planctomycetota bacterium]